MKNMTTLGEVSDRVDALSKNCWDRMVKVEDITFQNIESVDLNGETHHVRPIAQGSIAYRLGIPLQYLKKCPTELQEENLNYWIKKEKNPELFFRFDGDEVRAVFTPKYKPVDNFEVLERLDSLGYPLDTQVQCRLDGEFMVLNLPNENKAFPVNGDTMTPGISVSNSEVGLASLSISAFFLRLVCTNGLIAKTQVGASYRHVSRKILTEFPDVVNEVSRELGRQENQFKISVTSKVADPVKTIESFNHQFQLREPEREAVKWAWPMEQGDTMFHVVNAYTRAAQFEGLSAESSYRLQKTSGEILALLR